MKKIMCAFISVLVVLSATACTNSTETVSRNPESSAETVSKTRSDELKEQYSFYEKTVKEICNQMKVTQEQANEIFIILVDCGLNQEPTYIIGSNDSYTVDFGKISEGVTNLYVKTENGVVTEVKDGLTIVYPKGVSEPETSDNSSNSESLPIEELTLEAAVDSAIESARVEKDRVSINDDLGTGSGKIVLLYLKGGDNLTNKMIKTGMLMDTKDILQTLQPRDDISEITFFWSFPLVDAYGNTSEDTIMKVNISKETLGKINFERFDYNSIPDIADDYFEHTALSQ